MAIKTYKIDREAFQSEFAKRSLAQSDDLFMEAMTTAQKALLLIEKHETKFKHIHDQLCTAKLAECLREQKATGMGEAIDKEIHALLHEAGCFLLFNLMINSMFIACGEDIEKAITENGLSGEDLTQFISDLHASEVSTKH